MFIIQNRLYFKEQAQQKLVENVYFSMQDRTINFKNFFSTLILIKRKGKFIDF